jgi:hypothetical protein
LLKFKRFKKVKTDFIVGKWDQNDWVKEFPSKEDFDKYFPTVVLNRRWACHYSK